MKLPDAARWAALQPLLDELLALPPDLRAQRLEAIAAQDATTARDLHAWLRSHDDANAESFLDVPAAAAALRPAGATAGDALGGWTLVESIGEGGMGTVWRARRSDGRFEGEAAVKLLANGLFDGAAQERFRREGAILARLRHPGIAQLLDAGVTSKGQPYLVLELIRGDRLDRWCEARALPVRARLELFLQVLDAVAAAHNQLVIHRDLKPSNILVDESGRAKLLDFGIARLMSNDDDAVQTALTRQGAGPLTPAYAAPEQFQSGALSMATDVYALGIVLYEVLTGRHPSGLPAGSPPMEYLRSIQESRWLPPSDAAPASRRDLRGDLDLILAKACATEPETRYASASALHDDLRRHLDHEPIVARRATPWLRAAKLVRRRPLESAVAAAVAVAVPAGAHVQAAVLLSFAIGTGVALWQLRRARAQAALARAEQQRAEAVKNFIGSTFEQAVPREGQGGVVTAADLLESARSRIEAELGAQPEVAAELMTLVGSSFDALQQEQSAMNAFADAAARCERVFGRRHPMTLRARAGLYATRVRQFHHQDAQSDFDALVADLRASMPAAASDLVTVLLHRGFACTNGGREDEGVALQRDAVAIAVRHLGPLHQRTLSTQIDHANTLMIQGRYPEAITLLEPALDAARTALQRPHSLLAAVEQQMASCCIWQGQPAKAEPLLRQVLADQLALLGRETNATVQTRGLLAGVCMSRGDGRGAAAMQREVVAFDAALHPVPNATTATRTWHLGAMLVEAGEFEEGLACIARAEQMLEQVPGGNDQIRPALVRRSRIAAALCDAGRDDDALREADAVVAQAGQADEASAAIATRVRVSALRRLGRLEDAEAAVPAMLAARPATASPALQARADLEQAELHVARGRWLEGCEHAQRALDVLAPIHVPESSALRRAQELAALCQRRLDVPPG